MVALDVRGLEAVEVIGTKVAIRLVVTEHMVDAHQQTMRERDSASVTRSSKPSKVCEIGFSMNK